MSKQRILVTGGLGTVGSGLAKELKNRGHHVIVSDLYHDKDEFSFSIGNDIENPLYVRSDVSEFRQIERVFDNMGPFDFVYHCAAEFGRWNGEDFYEQLWKTNAVGTKNILRLQEKLKFKLIHFSSSEVYGDWPELMVESVTDQHAIKQLNDYAMTKWVNEMQIHNAGIMDKTESVIVRLFNTYGPGEYYSPYRSANCRFLYCALNDIPWTVFKGHQRTSTYLEDTVRTLANIIDNFKQGETYNIGGSELHTMEELSNIIIKVTGADPSLVNYKDSEPMTSKIKKVDVSKATKDLNHRVTVSLEEGIKLTADWMREVYKIKK